MLFHQFMRMRLTTTLQQPFAVQVAERAVVCSESDTADHCINNNLHTTSASEMRCTMLPKAIYVKFDDCDIQFLPPGTCAEHRMHGHDATCAKCLCVVQPGVFAVKPITRVWRQYLEDGRYVNVERTQMPLMPLEAVNLYAMQGTTAEPGLYAYWMFPKRCSETVQWLIVYVMLSRPRALANTEVH